jgi:anti-anti-sigma factor
MALLIFSRVVGNAEVFELHGSLDTAQAEKLEPRVVTAMDGGVKILIFDLTKLTYVVSAGLRIFLMAYRRLGNRGVRFVGLTPTVRQIFDVAGLSLRVEMYDTIEDAVVGPKASD